MGLPSFSITACVVDRGDSGGDYCDLSLFSTERGLLKCRCRLSPKKPTPIPDLFSEIEAVLSPVGDGGFSFMKEWRLEKARSGIGANYGCLEAASGLTRLILANARWLPAFEVPSELMAKALDALDAGAPPEPTRVKALFLLVRSEGYPVEEDWMASLIKEERTFISRLIQRPVRDCRDSSAKLPALRKSLERWMFAETEFVL